MFTIKKTSLFSGIIFGRYLWQVTGMLFVFIVSLFLVKFFILDFGKIKGKSMEPAFLDDQVLAINKFAYLFKEPRRYDVVQVMVPVAGKLMVKRIVGLPGEIIIIKGGKVYIGRDYHEEPAQLEEYYLPLAADTRVPGKRDPAHFLVGRNQFFVLGDNRGHSVDSRVYGPVHRSNIVGKVAGKLY